VGVESVYPRQAQSLQETRPVNSLPLLPGRMGCSRVVLKDPREQDRVEGNPPHRGLRIRANPAPFSVSREPSRRGSGPHIEPMPRVC